ncbi:hypothetical protein MJO52_06525 [Microbulbifer variabilis]|uniref:Uncharacterized protein n=1 Tax=Microbulbifer variabilis TaxID=266805 RepID=A0ABY4VEP4_9GAMM|nr:hypothetical protein [Microbulbifer variabilis]USD22788.1 hypothetical protein MJO52_06525 [Microbulbifer variabilis]
MNDFKLTKEQAFLAMFSFLDGYFQLTKSDDVGGLLGSMSLLSGGGSADTGVQEEWNEAVEKAINGKVNAELQFKNT